MTHLLFDKVFFEEYSRLHGESIREYLKKIYEKQIHTNEVRNELRFFHFNTIDALKAKPNNYRDSYSFAQTKRITEENYLSCFLIMSNQSSSERLFKYYRNDNYGLYINGKLSLIFPSYRYIKHEMKLLFDGILFLSDKKMDVVEVFYHAAILHLLLVSIHPFSDGNGRMARLLEKWFLAQNQHHCFWHLPTEHFYFQTKERYYANLYNAQIDKSKIITFLCMLPECLKEQL